MRAAPPPARRAPTVRPHCGLPFIRRAYHAAPQPPLAGAPIVPLGASPLRVSPVGIGTWQWGDTAFWGYGKEFSEHDCEAAYRVSRSRGINLVDTAEAYKSEVLLAKFLENDAARSSVVLASKYAPLPYRWGSKRVERALMATLARLRVPRIDLYQAHWAWPPFGLPSLMNALADQVDAGRTRALGVSNFSVRQTEQAHALLAKRGIPLACVQVEYNLLNRKAETSGLLKLCSDLNVSVIAYSPLAMGVLSGKYHTASAQRRQGLLGYMPAFRPDRIARIAPLVQCTKQQIVTRHTAHMQTRTRTQATPHTRISHACTYNALR